MGQAVAFAKPEGFVRSRGGRALGSAVDVTFVAIAGAALVLAVPATAPAAVTFGQLDDFQDGTAMGHALLGQSTTELGGPSVCGQASQFAP